MKTQEIITEIRNLITTPSYSPLLPQEDVLGVAVNIIVGSQNLNLCGTGEFQFSFALTVRGYKEDDLQTRALCDSIHNEVHQKTTTNILSLIGEMPRFIGLDEYGRYNYSIVFNAIAKGD